MYRVTNQMLNNTMKYNLMRHQKDMDKIQKQLATGKTVDAPRDNPTATTDQMIYRTGMSELTQYEKNLGEMKDHLAFSEDNIRSITEVLHRIRTLAVQGSQGTYTSFELKEAMATEINQLLEQLVDYANAKDGKGRSLFGGFETGSQNNPNPFVPIYQTLTAGNQGNAMIGVEYRGDIGKMIREVGNGEFMELNIPGNQVFWASNQILTSNADSSNYQAATNQTIKIDGIEIEISAGDNVDIIIDKINNAGISVKASKGLRNNLIFEGTVPHQIWLEDMGAGTVLKDLGMVNQRFPEPPNNIDPTVTIDGMSLFEMVITIRDDLVRGDQELVGGRDLGMIDMALENILRNTSKIGARENRVDHLLKRTEYAQTTMHEMLAKSESIDYPETIMNFKWLESVHNYALAVGAKTIKPTLMDFLR